jgi:16S rRNA (adenine1518-N6/adenine1519-N6)-dimethyltransferase
MVQKEVARRYMAKPGDDEYGSISCFVTYYAEPEYLCTVKSSSFYPKPEVDSAIMRLKFLDQPAVKVDDEELFFRIVRGAFNQRRKSILNSLSRDEVLAMPKDKLSATLCRAGIDPSARPETLGLSDFARIANSIRIA